MRNKKKKYQLNFSEFLFFIFPTVNIPNDFRKLVKISINYLGHIFKCWIIWRGSCRRNWR